MYDPTTGRFNSLDPFFGNSQDPQSFHKYAYVHGDPIQGVDPTGKFLFSGFLLGQASIARMRGASATVNLSVLNLVKAGVLDSISMLLIRGSTARDLKDQLPINGRDIWSNKTRVKISGSNLTAGKMFERLSEFRSEDFVPHTVTAARKWQQGGNDYITFDFDHILELYQKDFDVRIQEFDRNRRFMSVVTLGGHPLSGFRYFRVLADSDDATNFEIETAAVDHPTLWNDYGKMYPDYFADWLDLGQLTETWVDAFQTMAKNTGGTHQTTVDTWYSQGSPEIAEIKRLVKWRTQE